MSTSVICIGSPFGDDQFGAWAYERLRPVLERHVALHYLDRPGMRLTHLLADAPHVILIDAVKSGAAVGHVHCIEGEDIVRSLARHTSTHGFGVAEALALARRLGQWPQRLVLLGVEAGATDPSAPLSQGLRDALTALVSAVRAELALDRHPPNRA